MTDRAISIVEPAIALLCASRLPHLRRPQRALAKILIGDRLWVREPFHLPAELDRLSPTRAAELGAAPIFAADWPDGLPEGAGKRHYARSLPKAWHRQHLLVTALSFEPLQAITDAEILAEGFESRIAYAAAWDALVKLSDPYAIWASNPVVTVLAIDRVATPLPVDEVA